jgi:hypothetical protein
VIEVCEATAVVVTEKGDDTVDPAGIVTDAGTNAIAGLELESAIAAPPGGAALVRLTALVASVLPP